MRLIEGIRKRAKRLKRYWAKRVAAQWWARLELAETPEAKRGVHHRLEQWMRKSPCQGVAFLRVQYANERAAEIMRRFPWKFDLEDFPTQRNTAKSASQTKFISE